MSANDFSLLWRRELIHDRYSIYQDLGTVETDYFGNIYRSNGEGLLVLDLNGQFIGNFTKQYNAEAAFGRDEWFMVDIDGSDRLLMQILYSYKC